MTATALVVLAFLIFRPGDDLAAEDGTLVARSCAVAEAFIRDGLQPGQSVLFGECVPYAPPPLEMTAR